MTSITIKNLEEGVKQRLRRRAAEHGLSLEEEVREILRKAAEEDIPPPQSRDGAPRQGRAIRRN